MKKIKTFNLLIILLSILFISCNENKTEIKKSNENEISKTTVKKEKKEKKGKKLAKVTVDAIIKGENFTLNAIDFKKSGEVVYLNDGLQFKFVDVNDQLVLVNIFSPEIHKTTPITFSQQISALSVKEQASTRMKRSRLEIVIPTERKLESDSKIFYDGNVVLEEFTDDKIVVSFKGKGFTRNLNPSSSSFEDKLFPMEGKIIVENFKTYDGRY